MPSNFVKRWEEKDQGGLKGVLKQSPPLRSKIELAIRRIEAQIQYLENTIANFSERDKYLFSKIVDLYSKNQIQRASIFANELAELRKMANFMMNAQLALERVVLRLRTVTQLGNVVVNLAPAAQVLQSVRTGIAGIMPNAEKELENIGLMLNDIMIEAGQTTGISPDIEVASEDARKILAEASMVAEQRMKEKFPELPALKQPEAGEEFKYPQY
ncbi:MAG: Snf7 family protein [Nitrososphaerota archaeon]|nr:Snf7 family protein [Candidatus Bathyarchaeota archaeon]MDW8048543.1 Snf7 family protein [Nitrososphaerota archaeon]